MYYTALEVIGSDHVRVAPNVVVIRYDRTESGERPPTDVTLRVTFFFDWDP